MLLLSPHIKKAYQVLEVGGAISPEVRAALELVTELYLDTPQVNRAVSLSETQAKTENELWAVSSELLKVRKDLTRHKKQLAQALATPSQHRAEAYRLRKRLREMDEILTDQKMRETKKLYKVQTLVTTALSGELQLHGEGDPTQEASAVTCGTVTGAWHFYGPGWQGWGTRVLGILDVRNTQPHNGQFMLFLRQLITYCLEQELDLVVLDVLNKRLYTHLIKEWAFQPLPDSNHLVRSCYSARVADLK